jgi:hypothetical protein
MEAERGSKGQVKLPKRGEEKVRPGPAASQERP